jgi:hypothetical protein
MATETQVFNYLNHVLSNMKISTNLIKEESNLLFDFNFSAKKIDVFYTAIERQYQVPSIRFNQDVATLGGLMRYILTHKKETIGSKQLCLPTAC